MDIKHHFPSLSRIIDNKPCVFLDGPAGTQVPQHVIEAISGYYTMSNANTHGTFVTTIETDHLIADTRSIVSDFLGAEGAHNISFGQNMTSLNYSLANSIGKILQPGDEILITQLDHEANRGPWLSLRSLGIVVREVKLQDDGVLDYQDFEEKINERTRLVCMGWSSNLLGTVNEVFKLRQLTYKVGAWLLIDAVHYAPHYRIDVQELGCDFLLCSAYKFYGPHVGILYAKTGLLDQLPTDRLRTTNQHAPYSIETGTLNHAAIVGVKAAIEFISSLGSGDNHRDRLDKALAMIQKHESQLINMLYDEICHLPHLRIIGPSCGSGHIKRAPTLSFLHSSLSAREVCTQLAHKNIFAWDGHFYALRAVEVLGLLEKGGVTRMGVSAYTTETDIDMTIKALSKIN